MVEGREKYIQGIHQSYQTLLTRHKIDNICGTAHFVNASTLNVGSGQYTADHIVIATGGHPNIPDVPGAELGITSNGFFALNEQPERVAVVGAGYVAVELSGLLHALDTDVNMLLRRDRFLRSFDSMLSETLTDQMNEQGVHIRV